MGNCYISGISFPLNESWIEEIVIAKFNACRYHFPLQRNQSLDSMDVGIFYWFVAQRQKIWISWSLRFKLWIELALSFLGIDTIDCWNSGARNFDHQLKFNRYLSAERKFCYLNYELLLLWVFFSYSIYRSYLDWEKEPRHKGIGFLCLALEGMKGYYRHITVQICVEGKWEASLDPR